MPAPFAQLPARLRGPVLSSAVKSEIRGLRRARKIADVFNDSGQWCDICDDSGDVEVDGGRDSTWCDLCPVCICCGERLAESLEPLVLHDDGGTEPGFCNAECMRNHYFALSNPIHEAETDWDRHTARAPLETMNDNELRTDKALRDLMRILIDDRDVAAWRVVILREEGRI